MQHLAADLARVDFHHHFALDPGPISEYGRRRFRTESGWPYPEDRTPWTPQLSLRAMDELGIQVALLSMLGNPGGSSAVRSYPDRFGLFADARSNQPAGSGRPEMALIASRLSENSTSTSRNLQSLPSPQ